VSSGILENTLALPLSGGELIFWPAKPTFILDAAADLDYRATPWVQLTDPAAREWLISVVAPFRQAVQWPGSVGNNLLLRELLRWLIRLVRARCDDPLQPPARRCGFGCGAGGCLWGRPLYSPLLCRAPATIEDGLDRLQRFWASL
jgi:hypothetical protein